MLYKSSILTGVVSLVSLAPAIASEITTVNKSNFDRDFSLNSELISEANVTETSELLAPSDVNDPVNIPNTQTSEPVFSFASPPINTQDLAISFVNPISDAIPTANEGRQISQIPPKPTSSEPKKWAVGIRAQAATTGFIGIDGGYKFNPNFQARLGLNTVGFGVNYSSEGIDYDAKLQPTNIHLLGDYFPFGGGLRLTGGFIFQNNRFTATAKSGAGNTIFINNNPYNASDLGTVESEGKFGSSVAPYLGLGFGSTISSGFGFHADAGVMFAGSPSVKLTANNISSSVPAETQAQIRSDLAAQEQKTNEDIKSFNIYPVISIGVSYSF